jgi:uncharacterized protein
LNDRVIHFLVEHECNVLVSVDGDRETHDRYRVYKNNGKGSFNTVEKNLQRFAKLYPQYNKRGIILTLTASTNFYQTNEFLKKYVINSPSIIVNFADSFLGVAQESLTNDCEGNNCIKFLLSLNEQTRPDFLNWTHDVAKKWHDCNKR